MLNKTGLRECSRFISKFKAQSAKFFDGKAERQNLIGPWRVKIQHISAERNIVVPIKRNLEFGSLQSSLASTSLSLLPKLENDLRPNCEVIWEDRRQARGDNVNLTNYEPGLWFHFFEDRRVKLVENNSLLSMSEKDWNQHQLGCGNNMMDSVGNDYHVLSKAQQEVLNILDEDRAHYLARINQLEEINRQKDEIIF